MRARHPLAALALAASLWAAPPAGAEMLVAAVSSPTIEITSNFTGTRLAVFGAIERDAVTVSRAENYDVVIVVTGPRRSVVVRRKERVLGLWANRESRIYVDVPSFYAVAASRKPADVAIPAALKQHQIGLANLIFPEAQGKTVDLMPGQQDFRDAFLRLQMRAGLYAERNDAVEFLSPHIFRTTVPIPANVPIGSYRVEIFLFQGSVLLARKATDLSIVKTGFEQKTHDLAVNRGWLYGLVTVLMALLSGWLAGIIFRRD